MQVGNVQQREGDTDQLDLEQRVEDVVRWLRDEQQQPDVDGGDLRRSAGDAEEQQRNVAGDHQRRPHAQCDAGGYPAAS